MAEKTLVESVWDYPRPPRLEQTPLRLRIVHRGVVLAETSRAWRVLETSHPPVYYLPPEDVRRDRLEPSGRGNSFCEWKGAAAYWDLKVDATQNGIEAAGESEHVPDVAWSYAQPTARFAPIRDHFAFYASRVDECTVDGERVAAQPGDFYGGWINSWIKGPFKGAPGTWGW